ncbi:hypothetical protein JNB71_01925 [Rhizobium herbae]|uniref:Uncharacterized protein n=1 Tax=Rhizobium herbae TaxID=508661 RepID=A0ABS7H4A8_9HYPH|nr:hypothetical protein [Rhizobium herbae]MBW9062064.1 hypothetical protein [Rhizobium herbae]
MGDVTKEMIYAEVVELDRRLGETVSSLEELVSFMKETNQELAEGRARTEALKQALFGDRFDRAGVLHG